MIPPNSAVSAARSRRRSPRASANAVPRIGVISGETSIAPMIKVELFTSKPKLAITAERPSRI